MTLNILFFLLILIILLEIIEYEKSWRHLFIIIVGLLYVTLNISSMLDFPIVYGITMMMASMIYAVHRLLVVSSTSRRRDWDDEL